MAATRLGDVRGFGAFRVFGREARRGGAPPASAVPKVRVNGRSEDVIFFDGVFFESSLKSIFFAS